jgi:hypothetical protein
MTKREAAIISAYTGIMVGDFSEMHKYAEELFKAPVFSHLFGMRGFADELKIKSEPDFMNLCANLTEDK